MAHIMFFICERELSNLHDYTMANLTKINLKQLNGNTINI
jgi:predicted secreted acid phosphatase